MLCLKSIILPIIFLNCCYCNLPCDQVSISYCNNHYDDPDLITTTHSSLDECRQTCDDLPTSCVFTEYLHKEESCSLWAKTFSVYAQDCNMIGAPKQVTEECDIDMEESDGGCSVFRQQDCMYGEVLETITSLPSWKYCQQACNINPDCLYWTWEREQEVCRLTASLPTSCYRTISPAGLSQDQCQVDPRMGPGGRA
eukprot:GFUD01020457.1.p1 GENE.GFUD01020457.1~~GFUD01020457.1.p1  ORF type:complete len:197 (-),score=55.55 GFUD01020457.1:91-681(-)